jgi:hypothetical protein
MRSTMLRRSIWIGAAVSIPVTACHAPLRPTAEPVPASAAGDVQTEPDSLLVSMASNEAVERVSAGDAVRLTETLKRLCAGRIGGVSVEQKGGATFLRLNAAARSVLGADQLFVIDGIPVAQSYAVTIPASRVRSVDIVTDSAAVRPYGLAGKGAVLVVSLRGR